MKRGGQLKRIPELVREAALVAYGLELPDVYVLLIVSGRMSFRDAIREANCETPEIEQVIH